ncbi:4Fe-4S double cluster binding domain-containing protein [Thermodesulfobacteriota bacterium]
MPLLTDHPIDFGVTEFCEHCQRCVKACPSGAISSRNRMMEGYGMSNNPGVLKWQLDSEKCDDFQAYKLGTNCTICMRVCPFNKKGGWMSLISRHLIKKRPTLTPWIVKMDKSLGFEQRIDSELFWRGKI